MRTILRSLFLVAVLASGLLSAACSKNREAAGGETARVEAPSQGPGGDAALEADARGSTSDAPPLYDDLGTHTRAISTDSDRAQAYFDQGLRLQYAFNHAEAIRSYRAALAADPECAMCWWGIALAAGPNINGGMDDAGGRLAYQAAQEALELAGSASEAERMLIEALAERYGPDPMADRAALDTAYADAMAPVAEAHPRDVDVLTLRAAALMNLSPWFYWEGPYDDRTARPGTTQILAALEEALDIDRNHPGACHYLIHAVEAAFPERAVGCADRLAAQMPGAGHIVHMPGHIYVRVGRYADAVEANRHAVHEDEQFIADQNQQSVYTGAYYPHNYHFMAFAATMAGMKDEALFAAREVAPKVPLEVARAVQFIQNAIVLPQLTLVTFGEWEAALEVPAPDESLDFATTMHKYAQGTALAALGRSDAARALLGELRQTARAKAQEAGGDPASNPVFSIAALALAGEIALRVGEPATAAERFREAVRIEDGMKYEEPPLWYYPLRHSLGRALLEAGDTEAAEAVYREDLTKFRENGWALFGLAESLEAQGEAEAAAKARARFEEAWKASEVELTASRF